MKIRAIIDGKVVFGQYCNLAGSHYIAEYPVGAGRNVDGMLIGGWIKITIATAAVCTDKQDKTGKDIYGSKGDMLGGDRVHVHGNNKATVEWQTHQQTWGIWGQCLCGYSSGDLEIIPQDPKETD